MYHNVLCFSRNKLWNETNLLILNPYFWTATYARRICKLDRYPALKAQSLQIPWTCPFSLAGPNSFCFTLNGLLYSLARGYICEPEEYQHHEVTLGTPWTSARVCRKDLRTGKSSLTSMKFTIDIWLTEARFSSSQNAIAGLRTGVQTAEENQNGKWKTEGNVWVEHAMREKGVR